MIGTIAEWSGFWLGRATRHGSFKNVATIVEFTWPRMIERPYPSVFICLFAMRLGLFWTLLQIALKTDMYLRVPTHQTFAIYFLLRIPFATAYEIFSFFASTKN